MEIRPASTAEMINAAQELFDYPLSAAAIRRFLAGTGHHLLLAYADGRPVGFVSGVELTHPDKGTEMFLYELAVLPDYQRRGYGKALVSALARVAADCECYGMWVLTDEDNLAAMHTYRSAGAVRVEPATMLTWDFGAQPGEEPVAVVAGTG